MDFITHVAAVYGIFWVGALAGFFVCAVITIGRDVDHRHY